MANKSNDILWVVDVGRQPYKPVWDFQKRLNTLRQMEKIPDTLILVEHHPVYTIGKNGSDLHVVATDTFLKDRGIEVVHVDRGGDVTYHGPGQLVGYPIFNLHYHRESVSWFMRQLEEVFIRLLQIYGIVARREDGYTGVWVGDDKIVALGVRIRKWVTMHGFAFNVQTDLSFYEGIIPCGIFHKGVTSLHQLLDEPPTLADIKPQVVQQFQDVFGFQKVQRTHLTSVDVDSLFGVPLELTKVVNE